MKQTVGMIGAGNMGAAILAGIYKTYKVNVCEADKKRARKIKTKYKVNITDLEKTITSSDIILLAVKPQSFTVVLAAIKPYITKRHIVVSIAAGITCRYIEKALGQGVKVVRTMPNLPAQISQGITALAAGKNATRGDLKRTSDLLKSVGQTVIVDENMIDAVTAVSGSGPAYVFLFAELFIKSAKAVGLKDKDAKKLVMQTLRGSLDLLDQSDEEASVLREAVTSKGGTTAAALNEFKKGKLDKTFNNALRAAKKRSKTLAK